MELWQEMKEAESIAFATSVVLNAVIGTKSASGVIECEIFTDGHKLDASYIGKTEADAISGCWLKWKESK
jgi:hypothetical protein